VRGVVANLWQKRSKVCSGTTKRKIHANNGASLAMHYMVANFVVRTEQGLP